MKQIKAKKDFTINGNYYFVGDNIAEVNYAEILKLNEKGFIEPLNIKDLVQIKKELERKGEE